MNYYHMCQRGIGRPVEIRTRDGRIHRGIIHRVDNRMVYLRPLPGGYRGYAYPSYGGYGYPYGGWGWGWGWGFGAGIALGAIGALAFLPWFFW